MDDCVLCGTPLHPSDFLTCRRCITALNDDPDSDDDWSPPYTPVRLRRVELVRPVEGIL